LKNTATTANVSVITTAYALFIRFRLCYWCHEGKLYDITKLQPAQMSALYNEDFICTRFRLFLKKPYIIVRYEYRFTDLVNSSKSVQYTIGIKTFKSHWSEKIWNGS